MAVPAHAAQTGSEDQQGAAPVRGAHAAQEREAKKAASPSALEPLLRTVRARPIPFAAAGAAVLVAIIVVVVLVGILPGFSDGSSDAGAGSDTAPRAVAQEPTSASIPGGGTVLADGAGAYLALGDGVYYRDDLGAQPEAARLEKVVDGEASCLNLWGGGLLFLSGGSWAADPFAGTSVCVAEADGQGGYLEPVMLYEASAGARLSCLTVAEGAAYFLEAKGDAVRVLTLEADAGSDARELGSWKADRAWLFAENGTLCVATTADDSWRLEALEEPLSGGRASGADEEGEVDASVPDGEASFSLVMKGEGKLAAACYAEGVFYHICEGEGAALAARTSQGGFDEYPGAEGAVRIVAADGAVAVATRAGGLVWVDTATGMTMDKTDEADEHLDAGRTTAMGVGMAGEWLIATDGEGAFVACSREDGHAFGGEAGEAVDDAAS